MIELNETVTWRAKHLGFYQTHTSKITGMEKPNHFTDVMLKGRFKSFKHQHIFREDGKNTIMTDILEFESPLELSVNCSIIFSEKLYEKIFIKKK